MIIEDAILTQIQLATFTLWKKWKNNKIRRRTIKTRTVKTNLEEVYKIYLLRRRQRAEFISTEIVAVSFRFAERT